MEWIKIDSEGNVRNHLPMDGSTFLALWKGQFSLVSFDDEIDHFWLQMLPDQYRESLKLAHEREWKFTHYCLLQYPKDY